MEITQFQEQLRHKLSALQQQIVALPEVHSTSDVLGVIDGYACIFNDLFGDEKDTESYIRKLSDKSSRKEVDFYFDFIITLKNSIQNLPFESTIKDTILSRITDNCDLNLLKRFELKSLDEHGYRQMIKNTHPISIVNTVSVKTWGTKHEISNGLRNVLQQQIQGEGVGHASVTMRLKGDDKGLELIKKYCLNNDGSVKIPYEIKKYGNAIVYEVYWSFWPEGLQTLKTDINTEQSSVEHKDDVDTLHEMPLELKARYLFQKFTQERRLPLLGPLNVSEKQRFFKSDITGHRKMGLSPVAIIDASTIEPDHARRNYLELKVKQYQLNDEINVLNVLNDNYLALGKPFDTEAMHGSQPIKNSSNFLVLLKRFHSHLSQQKIIAQILLNKKISPEQSKVLHNDIRLLIEEKEKQKVTLADKINKAAKLIQENQAEIGLVQSQIDELHDKMENLVDSLGHVKTVLSVLGKVNEFNSTYTLTGDEVDDFISFSNACNDNQNVSAFIKNIIKTRVIDHDNVQALNSVYFHEYESFMNKQLKITNSQFSKKTTALMALYSSNKEERMQFYQKTSNEIDKKILRNQADFEHFAVVTKEFQQQQMIQAKIDRKKMSFEAVDSIVLAFINDTDKKKKGKAPSRAEIPYETGDTIHMCTVNTFDEVQLRNKIDMGIQQLERTQKIGNEGLVFYFQESLGNVSSRKIKSLVDLANIEKELKKHQNSLLENKEEVFLQLVKIKMGVNLSAEEFAQRKIQRGSSNDTMLRGFNIEKMLEKASELASPDNHFHLGNENCSTTSMKLLHAGAPDDKKTMFIWQEAKKGEAIPSNAFLINPQAVYSAATLVERADNGNTKAQALIRTKQKSTPEYGYNALLNQFASTMTMRNDVRVPGKTATGEPVVKHPFSWTLLLKFIPHLLKLYRDIFQVVALEEEKKDTLQAKIAYEIKGLSGHAYLLIDTVNASLALHKMLDSLQKDKVNVPFFENDTLSLVEQFILTIEAKESQTEEEVAALTNFKLIETERNARIQCIENAIISGAEIKTALLNRESLNNSITWRMSDADKVDALVKNFVIRYQEIRNRNPLSFLTSNFAISLDGIKSPQEKLEKIQQQVRKYPEARSSAAMKRCLEADSILSEGLVSQQDASFNTEITDGEVMNNQLPSLCPAGGVPRAGDIGTGVS